MRRFADVVVFSKGKNPVLVVEIKAAKETSSAAAAQFRRSLIENDLVENAPFLLVAFKTTMFLWRKETPLDDEADFTVPIKPVLQLYLKSLHDEQYAGESIQIAVHSWLRDLAIGIRKPDATFPPDRMLLDSGLYDQMHFGDVRSEVAP
jgi:hypothetical protein